jgi:hypothetical protein
MNDSKSFPLWAALVAVLALCLVALAARAEAQIREPGVRVMPYTVADAAAVFEAPLPRRALLFRNGLYLAPVLDYEIVRGDAGSRHFRFRPGVVSEGDLIVVVELGNSSSQE